LQNKIPYIAPAAAIEGYEGYWENANTQNYSVLPWNHADDAGQPIPAPKRQEPPNASQAYQLAMTNAANDMMLVSGQYQADFGAPSNERSGVAIQQRQRQGATATYHYIDHLAMALRFAGKIIIDLVPRIYDTKRLMKIMAEDGSDSEVLLDPNAAQAFLEHQQKNTDDAKQIIFNPNVGRYDVISDVGPDFATRRQEAFNALTQIAASSPELMMLVGDLLFKAADFEHADELAERMERMVPAQAKGDGPNPQVVQLTEQVKALGKLLETMSQKLQEQGMALKDKSAKIAEGAEQKIIDVYDAETRRWRSSRTSWPPSRKPPWRWCVRWSWTRCTPRLFRRRGWRREALQSVDRRVHHRPLCHRGQADALGGLRAHLHRAWTAIAALCAARGQGRS
jgi:hypothetical protein